MPLHHHLEASFDEQMRGALKGAPWVGVSALLHAAALLVLSQFDYTTVVAAETTALRADFVCEEIEILRPEVLPPPPESTPMEVREVVAEDPTPVAESLLEASMAVGDEPMVSPLNAPFDSSFGNEVIGVGGGAGGLGRGRAGGSGPVGHGGRAVQTSIGDALTWLHRHQDPGGYWDCDGFQTRCKSNVCDGKGGALNDVGCTGLALLAFMGVGETTETGRHRNAVRAGLQWLCAVQDPDDGCVGTKSGQQFLYGHALATLALVESFALSRQPHLRRPAQKALNFIGRCRNPYQAWRYGYPPDGDNDASVTGWMLFALFAGKDAGLEVDDEAIKQGMAWVRSMTDSESGRTGYHEKGSLSAREVGAMERWPAEQSEAMTACSLLLDAFDGVDPRTASSERRTALVLAKRPRWNESDGSIDYYYWYYGSYAMWQLGGREWESWQHALLDAVVNHQRKEGDELGSWDPQLDPWGAQGGRIYSTALNALCLEVYYRYDKLFGAR